MQIDLTVIKNNLGALVLITGVLGGGIAFANEFYELKGDYYATQCEALHKNYLRIMREISSYEEGQEPQWLLDDLVVNQKDKVKYGCTY